ncbi:spore germination protein [Hazenella sp. IB182357]|uniref:Spore germination protein n=1 Tax=Polycladospora coralii TaxID=2771432 RepID=A0A926RYT5_9BACL|nr:spore germination protein [Polycladospora coralii]MBD1373801.1 spore germination protein [Polycladospora coralii]MBS7531547.1 spore germination protein [Polycladospora coralii]
MGTINNIFNVRINSVSAAASVNFGNTINIGAESINKSVGGSSPIGDFARNADFERNVYIDPDLADQSGPRVI